MVVNQAWVSENTTEVNVAINRAKQTILQCKWCQVDGQQGGWCDWVPNLGKIDRNVMRHLAGESPGGQAVRVLSTSQWGRPEEAAADRETGWWAGWSLREPHFQLSLSVTHCRAATGEDNSNRFLPH